MDPQTTMTMSLSLLKISRPPAQQATSSGGLTVSFLFNDNDETHVMPPAICLDVEKINKSCLDFQWENASFMQKTNFSS